MKLSVFFYLNIFSFWKVKFSIYLKRHVFVMSTGIQTKDLLISKLFSHLDASYIHVYMQAGLRRHCFLHILREIFSHVMAGYVILYFIPFQ